MKREKKNHHCLQVTDMIAQLKNPRKPTRVTKQNGDLVRWLGTKLILKQPPVRKDNGKSSISCTMATTINIREVYYL